VFLSFTFLGSSVSQLPKRHKVTETQQWISAHLLINSALFYYSNCWRCARWFVGSAEVL